MIFNGDRTIEDTPLIRPMLAKQEVKDLRINDWSDALFLLGGDDENLESGI